MRRPEAHRALLMVSPAKPVCFFPSKEKWSTLVRSIHSPFCGARRSATLHLVQVGPLHVAGAGVALGYKPGAAREVIPPLPPEARRPVPVVHVVGPLGVRGGLGVGHLPKLPAEEEFLDGTRTVYRAGQYLHLVS